MAPVFHLNNWFYVWSGKLMRISLIVVVGCLLVGCFYFGKDDYEDILQRPSSQWSSRDRLTIIAAVSQSNLMNKTANIWVVAIPYYPSVITAINRSLQAQNRWDETEFERSIAMTLVDDSASSLICEHTKLLDDKGIYHKDILEIDSLLFFVSLTNKTWPCAVPLVEIQTGPQPNQRKFAPIFLQSDMPCLTPAISNIGANIYLVNDQNLRLHPKWIWGRRHETLTSKESLLMMFQFRSGSYHFLKNTKETMKLVVSGFDMEINFSFPISRIR